MKPHRQHHISGNPGPTIRTRAFTRLELCACLAAGALLVALALPALATSQSRGQTAQCLNNLRLMGRAVQMWASDYQNRPPWRTFVNDGGLMPATGTRPGNSWFDLAFMSNSLVTPRILSCPADQGAITARNFPEYISSSFRGHATSYLLNLESFSEYPGGLLFGDRNVQIAAGPQACSAAVNSVVGYYLPSGASQAWTNAVHGFSGNIVVMDGSVSETTSEQLRAAMAKSWNDSGQDYVHLLKPR